jgi:hypothetical protein
VVHRRLRRRRTGFIEFFHDRDERVSAKVRLVEAAQAVTLSGIPEAGKPRVYALVRAPSERFEASRNAVGRTESQQVFRARDAEAKYS